MNTLSGVLSACKGTQYIQTLSSLWIQKCFSIPFIVRLLNSRGVNLLFIFKCLYTCIYRMKIDKAFLF